MVLAAFISGAAVMAGIGYCGLPTSTGPAVRPSGNGTQALLGTPPIVQSQPTAGPMPRATLPVTPRAAPVDFDLVVSQVKSPTSSVFLNVTLQAELNASLTNLGYSDAHNVQVEVRARVGDSYLKVNGADPLVVMIGNLPARNTASLALPIEIKMSLIQGNHAQTEGIIFEITVLSLERTKRFPDLRCTQTGCTYL